MLVKKLTPREDQILITYEYNEKIESSLMRVGTPYKRFTKKGVAYIQYATNNRYYHAPKA